MPALRSPLHRVLVLTALSGLSPSALAEVEAIDIEPQRGFRYALGAAAVVAPNYVGGSGQQLKLRPLWALRYGSLRLSGARASGLLDAAGESGSGVSADLFSGANWRLGTSLRMDSGRSPGDDGVLKGLPAIRSTLRGRLVGSVNWGKGWSSSIGYSSDLLGRSGGGITGLAVAYDWALTPGIRASVAGGGNWADRQHMSTYFGISPEVALATSRAAYPTSAGLMNLHTGFGLRMPLGGQWTAFGGAGVSQLQGEAAASPLTRSVRATSFSLALAWRSL